MLPHNNIFNFQHGSKLIEMISFLLVSSPGTVALKDIEIRLRDSDLTSVILILGKEDGQGLQHKLVLITKKAV